jgi:hypothetical protein
MSELSPEELAEFRERTNDRINLMEDRYVDLASKIDNVLRKQTIYIEEMAHFRVRLVEDLNHNSKEREGLLDSIETLSEKFDKVSNDPTGKAFTDLCTLVNSIDEKLKGFSWFIDATNKWRTQLFLGFLKATAFVVFIYMLAHSDSVKKIAKMFGFGG